ncbi:ANTH domain-containing protein [Cinnamomum micranthum f. kanehirae]|uniref:ANTH domain-containing protein n=1 Tax=Cinnamomum micranthum f. kanehirae TaxID=337451 RepID=A0A443PPV8_9MAGN|nr:ANTH domain-containing protein [Cinnamomum micranthum f. kanehirae]
MAPSKLRKAIGAVKDKTSISLAKVTSTTTISDLDVAIVKATRHEEHPADEKHVREIISLTSYSRLYITSCVSTLSKRLNKTHNWTVALKTLILIHHLLTEGDPAYEQEIFFATRRGTRLLNLSDFRDTSHPNSWDFSAFVRTFALYLDEKLECRMHVKQNRHNRLSITVSEEEDGEEEEPSETSTSVPVQEMKIEKIFARIQQQQQLLERFLACRPTGAAKSNRVVIVALHPIVKESFHIYVDIAEMMGVLIDRFMELEIPDCVKVFDIFSRIAKQFDDLDAFYSWCKSVGVARSSEFPEVERITQKKLQVMDEFIHDKSILAMRQKDTDQEPRIEYDEEPQFEQSNEDDLANLKALPPPESSIEVAPEEEEKEETKEVEKKKDTQEEGDLLNLREDAVTGEGQGEKLALALFAGESTVAATPPTWEAFKDDAADWETALVQSTSSLSNQKAALGGSFNKLLLDSMYTQAAPGVPPSASGSASSMAFVGRTPGFLALPAPPIAGGDGGDPFAASLAIAPPSYVQMSDMEKKQQLLQEEQLVWQKYARDGMQGSNPYNTGGGYTRRF